jgi:hypothetical protein
MAGPQFFPWVIVGLLAISMAVQLHAGRIRLYMAPEPWQEVVKSNDPSRFWLFVVAEAVAMIAAVAVAVFQ